MLFVYKKTLYEPARTMRIPALLDSHGSHKDQTYWVNFIFNLREEKGFFF